MANINITIRIDKELKKEADNLFHELGMSFTTAVTIFAKQAVREQRIPFDITLHQDRAVGATSMEVEKISNKYLDENKKSLPRTCKMKYLTKEQAIYLHKHLYKNLVARNTKWRSFEICYCFAISNVFFKRILSHYRRKGCASWIRTSFQSLLYWWKQKNRHACLFSIKLIFNLILRRKSWFRFF